MPTAVPGQINGAPGGYAPTFAEHFGGPGVGRLPENRQDRAVVIGDRRTGIGSVMTGLARPAPTRPMKPDAQGMARAARRTGPRPRHSQAMTTAMIITPVLTIAATVPFAPAVADVTL